MSTKDNIGTGLVGLFLLSVGAQFYNTVSRIRFAKNYQKAQEQIQELHSYEHPALIILKSTNTSKEEKYKAISDHFLLAETHPDVLSLERATQLMKGLSRKTKYRYLPPLVWISDNVCVPRERINWLKKAAKIDETGESDFKLAQSMWQEGQGGVDQYLDSARKGYKPAIVWRRRFFSIIFGVVGLSFSVIGGTIYGIYAVVCYFLQHFSI